MRNFFENLGAVFAIIALVVSGLVLLGIVGFVILALVTVRPIKAEITEFSVGYLTESAYQEGNFDDASITEEAVWEDSSLYMVVDFRIKATGKNSKKQSLKLTTCFSDEALLDVTVEEVPTGKLETLTDDGAYYLYTLHTVPMNEGEEKRVRMILKLAAQAEGEVAFRFEMTDGDGMLIKGGSQGDSIYFFAETEQ